MAGEQNVSGRSSAYGDSAAADVTPVVGVGTNQATRTESTSVGATTSTAVSYCIMECEYFFFFLPFFWLEKIQTNLLNVH